MKLSVRQTEAQLHHAVAGYLKLMLLPPAWFSTFPSGGGGEMRGKRLAGMGLRPGVPDILIIANGGRAHWLELKSHKGALSERQRETCRALLAAGCPPIAVARSLDEAKVALAEWGIPMRRASLVSQRFDAVVKATLPASNQDGPHDIKK